MESDDRQLGRLLTRREALRLMGVTGAALLAACGPEAIGTTAPTATSAPVGTNALPTCVVRPELTEGPYYVDEELNRSDVRSDPGSGVVRQGALLALTFSLSQIANASCTPLAGARVEIWHCDAEGVYSDVSDPGFNTQGQKFLRGYQVTDANGLARFITIYPGWYRGRTVHIHFKVHPSATQVFTSQLFFDDELSDQVFTQAPYAGRGQRNTLNGNDRIFNEQLLLNVTPADEGYAAAFDIGMQMD